MRVKINAIRVGGRIRKHLGDLSELEDSMSRVGLLQPILVDQKNRLIAGHRRLLAAKSLGWDTIEAHLIEVDHESQRLRIELEENTTHRNFTPDEREYGEKLLARHGRTDIFGRILAWLSGQFLG